MTDHNLDGELHHLLNRLRGERVIYFPIRHHSPACAWQVSRLIRELKPASVLIEGPASFTSLIPLILHPESITPFAIYTHYIDKDRRIASVVEGAESWGPARFAAYYPFCDYSPELAALRAGREVGASLRFIDLDYADHVLSQFRSVERRLSPRIESLMQERYLQRSAYLASLAKRAGCRDHNELWDHLFESRFQSLSTLDFARNVATYCFLTRLNTADEEIEADGTRAREATMARHIAKELKNSSGVTVVVTGGFHTVALPDLVENPPQKPKQTAVSSESVEQSLIRYSFDQLDSLNGYAAGMPSPYYYHLLWQRLDAGEAEAYEGIAGEIIVEIGRVTRKQDLQVALSTADEIAALEHASLIARMRGHSSPLREDLLDGIRSSFVKGSINAEGAVVLAVAERILSGSKIGDIPAEAGAPPIVADFRRRAGLLRLNIDDTTRKKLQLDLYRKASHRRTSRFLHCLSFLDVPFATFVAGPDFVRARGLDRIHELWEYGWSMLTEGALVAVAIYGTTVEEAAANRLCEAIFKLEEEGRSRNAAEATRMLIRACAMGLHQQASDLLEKIAANLSEDPSFASIVRAATDLSLLWQSREPLEAHRLAEVPELVSAAYARACYLAARLANCPDEETDISLEALNSLRELASAREESPDAELLWNACRSLVANANCNASICGGAAGILHNEGQMSKEEVSTLVAGHLGGAVGEWKRKVGFLRGLLATCREAAWQNEELIRAVDHLVASWDEQEFMSALPEMRLSFARLTLRETDRVAGLVASIYGRQEIGDLIHRRVTEGELGAHRRVTQTVIESLSRDHLDGWLKD